MDLRRLSGLYHSPLIEASGVHIAKGRKEGVCVCVCVSCLFVCAGMYFHCVMHCACVCMCLYCIMHISI